MLPVDAGGLVLSLIIPAYNEADRIGESLRAMGAYLAARPEPTEIVVVDDGSRDATSDVVRAVAGTLAVPVRLARYETNRGKGHALKVGFALSRGDRLLFSDADLSTPIEMADRLLSRLDEGYDLALGSRRMSGADLKVRQPRHREFLGSIFTLLVRLLAAPVSDATCGFKAFQGKVGRDLFARLRIEDWSFDAELLVIARRLGYRWAEVPVEWEDRSGSKVHVLRDALQSLLGLATIRANALLGRYRFPLPLDEEHTAIPLGSAELRAARGGGDWDL
jgi:dolichyl-phosphate beta-glucosyltransferase